MLIRVVAWLMFLLAVEAAGRPLVGGPGRGEEFPGSSFRGAVRPSSHLGARHYDPTTGRFLSPDPLGHGASASLYDFANGDPVNGFDPDGRFGKGWGILDAGGAMGRNGPQGILDPLLANADLGERIRLGVGRDLDSGLDAVRRNLGLRLGEMRIDSLGEAEDVLLVFGSQYAELCLPGARAKYEIARLTQPDLVARHNLALRGGGAVAEILVPLPYALLRAPVPTTAVSSRTAGSATQAAENGAARTLTAPANLFERTHGLSGRASSRTVRELTDSMRAGGWQGPPISVFEHNGSRYILDGHHRVQAAIRAGVEVPYNSIPANHLVQFGYQSSDDVIRAAAEAGPVKLP